jgi:hypothetical protein
MTTTPANLEAAYKGSYYTILGAGGDPQEWINGITDLFVEQGVGTPAEWFTSTGKAINEFAEARGPVAERDHFPEGLTVLMFKLDGLHGGKLAMFKLMAGDSWFDDIVDNMVDDVEDDEL